MFSHSQRKTPVDKPPKALPYWLAFALPVWGFLALVYCQVNFPPASHVLVGPDDYMRAVRVFDLLAGHGHPYLQPRLGPVGGAEILWSRLIDWPLALLVILFEPLAGGQEAALYWAATILPLLQFLILTLLVCWAVAPVSGRRAAPLALAVLLLLVKVMAEFKAGRIDHHGWQILLMIGGYGALARMYFNRGRKLWPVAAGLCFATSFAIGADLVLWTGLAAVFGGMFWLCEGREFEKPNLLFGGTLFAAAFGWFLLLRPAADFLVPACDGLSLTYLALALAVPLFWGVVALLPGRAVASWPGRFAVAAFLAAALGGALFALFPQCFTDPYGLHSEILYRIWQNQTAEARPLWVHARYIGALAWFFIAPLVLGCIAVAAALKADRERRGFWIAFGVVLALGFAISLFQIRVLTFAQILALWPLAWGLAALWRRLRARRFGQREFTLVLAAFAVCLGGLVLLRLAFASVDTTHHYGSETNRYCSVPAVSVPLAGYGGQLTLMTTYIFNGSELLFRTPHRVLAAPYHRDAAGMLGMYRIFAADADGRGPDGARALAHQYGVDMILLCPGYWPFPPEDTPGQNTLIRRLLEESPPGWLERMPRLEAGGFQVYRVK